MKSNIILLSLININIIHLVAGCAYLKPLSFVDWPLQ